MQVKKVDISGVAKIEAYVSNPSDYSSLKINGMKIQEMLANNLLEKRDDSEGVTETAFCQVTITIEPHPEVLSINGQEMRNVKENGVWVQKPFYTVKDKLPYGHGEKSVLLLQRHIKLYAEEVMAVRWHMAGFTPGITDYSISQAFMEAAKQYPLVIHLHIADMEATYLKENKEAGR